MKLTDFKNINEYSVRGVNNYGSAALQRRANQKAGNADAGLSTKETLGKNIFVDKFVQKASAGLENAIKTGAIQVTPVNTQEPTQAQQFAQTRQQKQAQAAKAAQDQMNKKPGEPQSTSGQQAFGQMANQLTKSPQQAKMTPQQTAALKGKLKAGAGATSAKSGFKDYVGGSGERLQGADASGAPVFKKIQREGKYSKLNAIFESILNEQAPTIASFIVDAWKAYLHGVNPTQEKLQQAQQLANQVQATYTKDKGQGALRQLGDLAWYASTESAGSPANQDDDDYDDTDQSQGPSQVSGSGNMRQVYSQVYKLLQTLDKQDRKQVLTAIQTAEEKANI